MLAPKSPDEMTTDATITDAARDHIRSYFAEFGAAGEEFERFVIEQLDHLEGYKPGSRIESTSWTSTKRRCTASSTTCKQHSSAWMPLAPRSKVGSPSATSGRPRKRTSRPNRLCPSMPRNSPRPCPSSRKSEPCSASRSQAHAQAQAQWQSISQTAVAELAQARAELAASSEDLAHERQRFAEAAAPLVEAISRQPARSNNPSRRPWLPSQNQATLNCRCRPRRANRRRAPCRARGRNRARARGRTGRLVGRTATVRRGLSKSSPQAAKTGGKQPDAKAGTKNARKCAHVRGTGARQYPQPIPRPAGRARQSPGEATDDQITSARGQQARIMVASPEQPVTASTAVTPVDAATKATRPRTSGRRETDRGDERLAVGASRRAPIRSSNWASSTMPYLRRSPAAPRPSTD